MAICDLSSYVCSSDLPLQILGSAQGLADMRRGHVAPGLEPDERHEDELERARIHAEIVRGIEAGDEQAVDEGQQRVDHAADEEREAGADMAGIVAQRRGDRPRQAQCGQTARSEEHTSELQSLMRISYAVFCLKKKKKTKPHINTRQPNTKY